MTGPSAGMRLSISIRKTSVWPGAAVAAAFFCRTRPGQNEEPGIFQYYAGSGYTRLKIRSRPI